MHWLRQFWSGLTLKPQGITMVLAAFLPVFAIIAMFPVVHAIITHFGNDPQAAIKVPAMVTAPGYAIALLAPLAGFFADRFGRRNLLLICTFFYGLVGCAPFFLESLNAIIASRIALGVCEAGILTIVNTLIADYWDDAGRRNWLMLQGMIGPAFQPLVFIAVASVATIRWNAGFLVYAVAFPIFIAMALCLFEPKQPDQGRTQADPASPAGAFPWGSALAVGAATLATSILYYVFIVNGSIAWAEIGVTDPVTVSKATAIPALFILAGSVLFRVVSARSNATQFATFLALFAVGLGSIGLAHSVPGMQAALIIQQTAAGMTVPALIAWSQSKFGFHHRGRGMGVWTSCFFLGQAVSPVIIGNIAARAGSMQAAFLAAGVAAGIGAIGAGAIALRR